MQLSIRYRMQVELGNPKHWVKKFYVLLMLWRRNYRTRRHLAELPDHLLQDIGLNQAQANREVKRGFWE